MDRKLGFAKSFLTELSFLCLPHFVTKKSRRLALIYCLVCTDPSRDISKTALDFPFNVVSNATSFILVSCVL